MMRVAVSITGFDDDTVLNDAEYHNYFKLYDIDGINIVSTEVVNLTFSIISYELVCRHKVDYILYGDLPGKNNIPRQAVFNERNEKVQAFYGVYGKADDVVDLFIKTHYLMI